MSVIEKTVPVRRISPNDGGQWLFGYFDKCPWDATGRHLLGLRVDFMDRPPRADDAVDLYVFDMANDNPPTCVAQSNAFCWQQANMLQWLPGSDARRIIFNDRNDTRFVSRIIDLETSQERIVDAPIYCISPDGRRALSINFGRLDAMRPGYGYAGVPDYRADVNHPDDDGIHLIDLETNRKRLIISQASLLKQFPAPEYEGRKSWFNHLLWNPTGDRFAFLHRCRNPTPTRTKNFTRMFTSAVDGSDLYLLNADEMTSHYSWLDDATVMAYAGRYGVGWHYFLFRDKSQAYELIGPDVFDSDGHCTPDPTGRWMLTDTYPRADHCRELILYDLQNKMRYDIGRFLSPPGLDAPLRCDLHPRWSRDGRQVCFDSLHEGFRGVYLADVSDITESPR